MGCCEQKRGVPKVGGGVEGGPARPNDLVQLDELRDGVPHLDGDLHHVPRGRHGQAGTWTWAPGASQRTHLGQPGGSTTGLPASPGTATHHSAPRFPLPPARPPACSAGLPEGAQASSGLESVRGGSWESAGPASPAEAPPRAKVQQVEAEQAAAVPGSL